MDREKARYDAALQRATAGGQSVADALKYDQSLRKYKKATDDSTKAYERAVNTFNTTQTTIKTLYDRLPEQSRRYLENDLGISKENIYDPKTLEVGQSAYIYQRLERAVTGAIANSSIVQTMEGQINPVNLGPPSAISPFNIEDPFLQYSKKMYNAWGVI
jgi:hypothetical protein